MLATARAPREAEPLSGVRSSKQAVVFSCSEAPAGGTRDAQGPHPPFFCDVSALSLRRRTRRQAPGSTYSARLPPPCCRAHAARSAAASDPIGHGRRWRLLALQRAWAWAAPFRCLLRGRRTSRTQRVGADRFRLADRPSPIVAARPGGRAAQPLGPRQGPTGARRPARSRRRGGPGQRPGGGGNNAGTPRALARHRVRARARFWQLARV